jgi:LPS export ABC transporter protein LptC
MRWMNTLLSFVLLFTIGTLAFSLLRNVGEEGRQGRGRTPFPLPTPDMVLSRVRFTDTQGGRPTWVIESDTATLLKEKNKAHFHGVHLTFYARDGRVMHLDSREGELDTETRDMIVRGDVRGRSSDGLEFYTSSLNYDDDRREIETRAAVKIVAPSFETQGVDGGGSTEERVRLLNQVRSMEPMKLARRGRPPPRGGGLVVCSRGHGCGCEGRGGAAEVWPSAGTWRRPREARRSWTGSARKS